MQLDSVARRASSLPQTWVAPSTGAISFESGHAFPDLLPDLTREAERALQDRGAALQYGPRAGLSAFRSWIAQYLAEDGIDVSSELVLVTNGAKHAIELVCRLLLDEGDSIVVSAPTYFTSIPIFRSFGVNFIEVSQDHEGLRVDELAAVLERLRHEKRPLPKFIYNIPEYHNPTGVTMSLERRKALIELAVGEHIFVVEDSPYRNIRFEGEPVASLKALDRNEVVFHVGTFSKVVAPGLRVGWVSASRELIARMAQLKSDGGSCPITQRIILEFCTAGRLAAHIERVRNTYRLHRDRMVRALQRELPEFTTTVPKGGYYLWLTLPPDVDGDELTRVANDAGVSVLAGSRCYARREPGHGKSHIRLAFSHAAPGEIDEGVRRLASAFRAISMRSPVTAAR